MPVFCIPKNLVAKLKQSALRGEVNIKELYQMSSGERRAFFEKYTDRELGRFINVEFEKAMVSNQKTAMLDWAQSVFSPKAKMRPAYKTVLDKINSLDELGVLSPASREKFLEDLVADKLGVNVSPDEVRVISRKADAINKAQERLGENLGNPEYFSENIDFFKAKKDMDDFLLGLSPVSQLKVLTGTVGRGMMLFSVKSPVLNIGSNTEVGIMQALPRRLSSGQIKGADNKLALEYVKMVNKIYQATGYDISRMVNLSDTGASGARVLGDTPHSQGKGIVRKVGRGVEDIVFKQMMGAPDVAFSSAHFADSVNLNSRRLAKNLGLKDAPLDQQASEWMRDAMRIKPKTEQGEVLRNQAIMDAQYATYTNKSAVSRVSESIRKVLNEITGDIRLGDFVMPFVKTPANVIAAGLDYGGLGFVKAVAKTAKALANGTLTSPETIRSISRDLLRSGTGLVGAVMITNQLADDDFVGAYDPKRSQIEKLRNSNYNAIRIGNKWINLDWFGPLGVPIASIMYSRKYGNTKAEKAYEYVSGAASTLANVPGLDIAANIYQAVEPGKQPSLDKATESASEAAVQAIYARLVPSLLADIAKATDSMQRDSSGGPVNQFKSNIPGARQSLPVKKNIFSQDMKAEAGLSQILFGSRIKTDRSTPLVNEISRVQEANDKALAFTDWNKTTSKTIGQFRSKRGDAEFKTAQEEYGNMLREELEKLTSGEKYKAMSDEDKFKEIMGVDADVIKKVLKRHGFVYKKEK